VLTRRLRRTSSASARVSWFYWADRRHGVQPKRGARDWQQMYLLAFLMLVAGSVLNPI